MTLGDLQNYLSSQGVELWLEQDKLRYRAAAGVMTPAILEEMKKYKEELVAHIKAVADFPLSFAQQRLWFFYQLEPESPAYNIFRAMRISGEISADALEKSIGEVVRRHDILRATFHQGDDGPYQKIAAFSEFLLSRSDIGDLPEKNREEEVIKMAEEESSRPFDLSNGPLLRASLIRLAPDEHVLFIAIHHIVSDGWSMVIMVKEIVQLYGAFSRGEISPLADLKQQYTDHVLWERDKYRRENLGEKTQFWKGKLEGMEGFELPVDHPRPAIQTWNGASQRLNLPEDLIDSLNILAREEKATLFMILLAAFQVLLYRYTGQKDISVGTPFANRSRVDMEGMIGFFVNTLVLRTEMEGDPGFRDVLQKAKNELFAIFAHQDMPFEKLVEELNPKRDLSRNPLFQIGFAYHKLPFSYADSPDLKLARLDLDDTFPKFDLDCVINDDRDGVRGELVYNSDLFDTLTVERMAEHFLLILKGIVASPDCRLSELIMLTEKERHQQLIEWNSSSFECLSDRCVHEIIEERAMQTPEAAALVYGEQQLTYGELNSRSDQIAHAIRKLGIGYETYVGVCLEKSPDAVIALLGIFKAGAVYVPLDPEYPEERLAYILKDSGAALLITRTRYLELFPGYDADAICLDDMSVYATFGSFPSATNGVGPDNTAYVIYTSGSTGLPKGVVVSQRALASHCVQMKETYGLGVSDKVLFFASMNFDVSLEEVLPSLFAGASIIMPDQKFWAPEEFSRKVQDYGVTVVNLSPSFFHEWLHVCEEDAVDSRPESLRLIISGGEEIRTETVRLWKNSLLKSVKLLNAYGPTEATITATIYDISESIQQIDNSRIPIGRPLPGRRAYIVDSFNNLLPAGVPGQLCLGGKGLAAGYHNRPDLTFEKFVPDLFSGEAGARLYMTGDIVRYRSDGNIEFAGRIDDQVKIRGFRIELGEVEAVLDRHPLVRDCVVSAREDHRGDKRLVAYVILHNKSEFSHAEMRDYVKGVLPSFMVPAMFIVIDEVPMTPAGKVDRRALPEPDTEETGQGRSFIPPQSSLEMLVAGIWCDMLELNDVGLNDNFFELGGHSLMATRVISILRTTLNVEVPLQALFERPTVKGLTDAVKESAVEVQKLEKNAEIILQVAELSEEEAGNMLADDSCNTG